MTQSLMFLKAQDGKLVYSTCSILKEENEAQIEKLMKEWHLELDGDVLKLLPETGSHDGFFAAVMKQKKLEATGAAFKKAATVKKQASKLSFLASKLLKGEGAGGGGGGMEEGGTKKEEEEVKKPYWPGQQKKQASPSSSSSSTPKKK